VTRLAHIIGGALRAFPVVLAFTVAVALLVLAGPPDRRTSW
jgi:hypothetical protein